MWEQLDLPCKLWLGFDMHAAKSLKGLAPLDLELTIAADSDQRADRKTRFPSLQLSIVPTLHCVTLKPQKSQGP